MSEKVRFYLGRRWVCTLFFVISCAMFGYFVPQAIGELTEGRTLAPRILDEFYPTWSAQDAHAILSSLGAKGRRAYQLFYWKLDFWFPVFSLSVFYASLLSLAFHRGHSLAWVNTLPALQYFADVAENINHYIMASSYPTLAPLNLSVGPAITFVKYALITVLPLLALAGFIQQWRNRQ